MQHGATTYSFNADGFLTKRGADSFTYSTRGELLSATVGSQTVSYGYDALGRRVARTDSTGTTQYLYANLKNAFQVTATRGPSGQLSTYYYDELGKLFALETGGARFYIASDQLGSPRVVSDSSGRVVKVITYDAFGRLLSDSNPTFDLGVGFAGGTIDVTTGLVRFGLRDYDPGSGRWTARDPLLFNGGTANLYMYAANDPVDVTDRTGLFVFEIGFSGAAHFMGGVSIEVGIVVDSNFNTGLAITVNGRLGPDVTLAAGPFMSVNPQANTIQEIAGWGGSVGIDAVVVSVCGTGSQRSPDSIRGRPYGLDPSQPWNGDRILNKGVGIGAGPGISIGAYVSAGYTFVIPFGVK